ncbi:MAG: glycosyltransferase [Candidatus Omnitrophota bacterium]|nr:glycosyltransferase [Candidatus Omnitrophota bacterium]
MKIDILILNYNGKELMGRFLPSIVEASKASRHECAITVVDNKSADDSRDFVKNGFPLVHFYAAKENRLLCSYNEVVKELKSDIVIFLNNDIKIDRSFIDHLIEHFKDEKVFFVAPKILNFNGNFNGGRSRLELRHGIIKSVTESDKSDIAGSTHFISCGAFRRDIFLKLGGFDDLYLPGIWEDVDLCYRAMKQGYKGIYEPKSIMWHDESTTFKKVYGNREKMILAHRNMFLFFWKNITDIKMLATHMIMLIPNIIGAAIKNNTEFVIGFFRALPKLSEAAKKRADPGERDRELRDKDLILWRLI